MSETHGRQEAFSDRELKRWIEDARAGSPEALGELLEHCRAYLLLVANRELATDLHAKGGASDLVQETCIKAHEDFGGFRGDTEAELLAWLRRILEHQLSNFARRYRRTAKRQLSREVPLELDDSSGVREVGSPKAGRSPSGEAIAREQSQAIDEALACLPEQYRQIILLVNREHRSFAEAGQIMNRSADAARRLWSRAIERLGQELEGGDER